MVCNQSDSDGTDDDELPPTEAIRSQGGVKKSRPSENREPSSSFHTAKQICNLEIEAYYALLRAFSAQSGTITWHKEELMSELRKELRVTDERHREVLGRVGNDEILQRIRTWRQTGKDTVPPHHRDPSPSPAIVQSRKKQKIGHGAPILFSPSPLLKPAPHTSILPSASGGRGLSSGKKSRNKGVADAFKFTIPSKGARGPPSARRGVGSGRRTVPWNNHIGPSTMGSTDSHVDSWMGRSLRIRWPKDYLLYEVLVVEYNKKDMLHCIAYDSGTPDESFEWIDLKRIGKNDIQWLDNSIDPVSNVLPLIPVVRDRGGFRRPMGRPKESDERRRPSISHDKILPAPTPQSRPWRGGAPTEVDINEINKTARRQQIIMYPEVDTFAKEVNALENENDLEKLESGRQLVKEYEKMLQKALAMATNFSIDDGSEDD